MSFKPDMHHRHSNRLRDYDYSQGGAYFVTICVLQRECLFGEIVDGEMIMNETGRIVLAAWTDLPNHYKHIILDEYVVMPNHFHGIIDIVRVGLKPAPTEKQHALSEIIRGFKTFSSRRINVFRNKPGCSVWQRNYYERVIRNENELSRAREYVVNNSLKWELDKENPINCR